MTGPGRVASEEELIGRYLAPLASHEPGALGLTDDCALLRPLPGEDLVLTTDAVAEGVHFLPTAAPGDVAWKALAVNVSDLAAKGAVPRSYLMSLAFPEAPTHAWMEGFAVGLAGAQEAFGLVLVGGDTDRRPGPLAITVMAIGALPEGKMVRRTGARAGDRILITGTLGDGALGLLLEGEASADLSTRLSAAETAELVCRYRRPEPRVGLAAVLRDCATAAMDVSDGLAKDLDRLCRLSGIAGHVDFDRLPLSAPARKLIAHDPRLAACTVSGGDDYEIVATVAQEHVAEFGERAAKAGIPVTEIGEVTEGAGLVIRDRQGIPVDPGRSGWDHFASLA